MAFRIGLNFLHLVPEETGGLEIYARRLVAALLSSSGDLELTLFASREGAPSLSREAWAREAEIVRLPVDARSRTRRVVAEQALLPVAVRKARVDLLHNLMNTAPAFPGLPQVTTILDVIYKRYPETHAGILAYGVALLVPLAARRSRRIVTISEAAKADIVRFLGVGPERVDVTHLGPGMADGIRPVDEQQLRRRFELGDAPLVLTVSAKRPHKNLERLMDAIVQLSGSGAPVLVVPGYPTPFEQELRRHAARLRGGERIRFTGWVDDATLEGLYRSADVFVFPSLAEGFGLPVLDAMRRGVPVACSNAGSLPEVAGEAALYFEPTDTAAMAAAVKSLLHDEALRDRLARAGLEQAKRFNWEATAAGTMRSYERALAGA